MKYIYLRIGDKPYGIYRFPTSKRSVKVGEYWTGERWVESVARTLKDAKAWSETYGTKIRKLTLAQAEKLIAEITNR